MKKRKVEIVDKKIPIDLNEAEYPYGENIIYDEELKIDDLNSVYNDGRIRVVITKQENFYSIFTYSFEDQNNAGYCYAYLSITEHEFQEFDEIDSLVYEIVTGEKDRFTTYGIGVATGISQKEYETTYFDEGII